MSLLTDLNDHWHFFLVQRRARCGTSYAELPKKTRLTSLWQRCQKEKARFHFVFSFIAPPLKKLKVDDFLPMPSDGADEMMERYELMADELEPEFLTERRMEYAQHLVQSMPMYAHMYT